MASLMNRRNFIGASAIGLASAGTIAEQFLARRASAADNIVAVMWGGPFIDASKPIGEAFTKKSGAEVNWELHAGGSVLVIAKIKATWPVVKYDLTTGWAVSFSTMIQEDWLETVTEAEIPNLRDVPPDTIMKDAQGNFKSVPLSITGTFWGYRSDLVKTPLTSIEQLLEPRFKGQLCMTDPINHTGEGLISFAIQRGGDEHNIEPGFEFAKELARRGTIGRIAHSEVDFINSLTTGETSVAFWNMGSWGTVAKDFPVTILNRLNDNKGFLAVEGWGILKGPRSKTAKEFANFFISPENNESYNRGINEGPVNRKSKPSPGLDPFLYKPDEVAKYGYYPDFPYISAHVDEWNKRWEAEIVPLVRQG
jgi:putative spermidine/putrescine transport system substrate-binding protein